MTEIANIYSTPERRRMGMRWFGPSDRVPITMLQQKPGNTNVITALHHIPPGNVWTEEEIAKRKIEVEFQQPCPVVPQDLTGYELYAWYVEKSRDPAFPQVRRTGLCWDVAESLPFDEEIKSGGPLRDQHIENFKVSLRNLARFGVTNVVGNFMLMADWTRTGYVSHRDGSQALTYDHIKFAAFDIFMLQRHDNSQAYVEDGSYTHEEVEQATGLWNSHLKFKSDEQETLKNMIIAGLPGAQQSFTLEDFRAGLKRYEGKDAAWLRENISYFLKQVVPVAKEVGVNLCSHPDDPAFSPFMGTPRAVGDLEGYKFLLDHGCGVNLCPGSLMANEKNRDIVDLILELADYGKSKGMTINQIFPHVHLRPIVTDGKNFTEGHHAENADELAQIITTLVYLNWTGVYRPDHALTPTHNVGERGYCAIGRGYGGNLLFGLFKQAWMHQRADQAVIEALLDNLNQRGALKENFDRSALTNELIPISRQARLDHIKELTARLDVSPYRHYSQDTLYVPLEIHPSTS